MVDNIGMYVHRKCHTSFNFVLLVPFTLKNTYNAEIKHKPVWINAYITNANCEPDSMICKLNDGTT